MRAIGGSLHQLNEGLVGFGGAVIGHFLTPFLRFPSFPDRKITFLCRDHDFF
jgi:hypothetical protein